MAANQSIVLTFSSVCLFLSGENFHSLRSTSGFPSLANWVWEIESSSPIWMNTIYRLMVWVWQQQLLMLQPLLRWRRRRRRLQRQPRQRNPKSRARKFASDKVTGGTPVAGGKLYMFRWKFGVFSPLPAGWVKVDSELMNENIYLNYKF